MASEVGISNLALSHLGETGNVSDFDEQSAYSDFCKMFYPIARDLLLVEGWSFNTRRKQLAQMAVTPPGMWMYSYATPSDMVTALSVLPPGAADDCKVPYILETDDDGNVILLTNQDEAILRYTIKITDPTKFSPLFTDTLTWLMASYLSGPVLKGKEGIAAGRAAYQTYQTQLAHAQSTDRNQQLQRQPEMSSGIAARYGSGALDITNFYRG